MTTLPAVYTVSHTVPSVETYVTLRTITGLTPFSTEASARGLPNSLFAVQILHKGQAVSTHKLTSSVGRITGDGGCFFLITDICTHSAHRGQGLAKAVMAELMTWLRANAPKTAFVSLSADGKANELYKQFGFRETKETHDSVGMSIVM
ncbi:MAG: hypothetical protein Q9209_007591 [Squamulea sp. 1 TL-2023]